MCFQGHRLCLGAQVKEKLSLNDIVSTCLTFIILKTKLQLDPCVVINIFGQLYAQF